MRARLRALVLPMALAAVACAAPPSPPAAPPAPAFDPVTQDPPPDPEHPAALHEISFSSGGDRMNAIVYVAAGAGLHPTAILLHGLPGNERNLDLAQALRRAGWDVVFFHYRGAWGSEGSFSIGNVLEDVDAVVSQVRAPAFGALHRADSARVSLVGHSMGGFAALVEGARLDGVRCVVSIAGANLGAVAARWKDVEAETATARALDAWVRPLAGTSGAALVEEIGAAGERFDTTRDAPALARKPVLLVAGRRDEDTPPALHHEPLARAIEAAGGTPETVMLDADHSFSGERIALAHVVTDFLQQHCR